MRTAMGAAAIVGAVAAACGGGQRGGGGGDEGAAGFDCNGRMVGYVAHGTIVADEIGVAMDCAERGPRIVRWQGAEGTNRIEDGRSMTTGEFDALWRKIDQTGWRDLGDCNASGDDAPTYQFSFRDSENASTCACQHTDLPFPYRAIVNELDAAGNKGGQLAPDDVAPDELAPEGKR